MGGEYRVSFRPTSFDFPTFLRGLTTTEQKHGLRPLGSQKR